MTSDPRTFNPILVTDSASGDAVGNLFDGLVRNDPMTGEPEPDLASSWTLSDGGRTITFHLRPDLRWSDGVPIDANDVLFTMRVIYDPAVPNSIAPSIMVDGKPIEANAPDPHTVQMKLPRVFAPLMYAIGFPIIPAHILGSVYKAGRYNQAWGINTAPRSLVANGSYLMTRYVPAQSIAFARNPDYWMRGPGGEPLPRLKGQTLLIVQDQNAAYLRFLSGQTDVYSPRPEEVIPLTDQARSLDITVRKIGIDTGSLFFAFNRNPRHYVHDGHVDPRLTWFTDLNFMRALAHLVDKRTMINLCYHGFAEPAVSDISPANKVFHNPNLRDYTYDPQLAARILDEAGYRIIRPGVRADPHGNPIVFNLATNAGASTREQMCAIFKQDLANLGIQVNYRPLEFTTLVDKLDSTFDWDCILIGFTGTLEPNNGANFLRSSGNLHIWNPREPKPATPWEAEIDRLLDDGTKVMDPALRAPYYWRIQEILHDQLPLIETVRQQVYGAWKSSLLNYDPTVWGLYRPELIEFKAQ
jgi:peptide/nickel transport system substrate-binding protein